MRDYKLSEARELRNFSGLSGRKQSLKKIKAGKVFIPVTFEFPVQLYHRVVKPLRNLWWSGGLFYIHTKWWIGDEITWNVNSRVCSGITRFLDSNPFKTYFFMSSVLQKLMCNGEDLFVSNIMLRRSRITEQAGGFFFLSPFRQRGGKLTGRGWIVDIFSIRIIYHTLMTTVANELFIWTFSNVKLNKLLRL